MSSVLNDIKGEFYKNNNAVIKLILINVIVFSVMILLYALVTLSNQASYAQWLRQQLYLPANFSRFLYKPWTLFTNIFVHEGPFHLFFNMLSLYWFGKILEEYLGGKRLVSIYLLGGLAGGLLFLLMYNLLPYFNAELSSASLLGASGAIYAIILAAATLVPDYTFFIFLIGPVRLKYIAAFFIILSLAQLVGPNAGGNLAHLAGAMVGFGFIVALRRGYDWGEPIYAIGYIFDKIFKPAPRPKVPQRARTTAPLNRQYASSAKEDTKVIDIPNQDEVDAILDKISKSGYASLTREEKQKLYKASQQ